MRRGSMILFSIRHHGFRFGIRQVVLSAQYSKITAIVSSGKFPDSLAAVSLVVAQPASFPGQVVITFLNEKGAIPKDKGNKQGLTRTKSAESPRLFLVVIQRIKQ